MESNRNQSRSAEIFWIRPQLVKNQLREGKSIATNIIAQAIIALLAREQHNITKSSNFPTLVATNISEQCHKDSEIYHQAYLLRIDWAKKLYNIVIILILFKFLIL